MKLYALALIFSLSTVTMAIGETPAAPSPPPQEAASSDTGTISGKVMVRGNKPMNNGIVLLFNGASGPPPHPYKYWRIPDFINGTDKKGNFLMEVPQGTYYLMIAQKKPDGEIGPPRSTEFLYFHGDAMGNAKPIVVSPGKVQNLGLLTKSFVWSPKNIPRDKDITAIEGAVVNMEGKPVDQAIVFAYLSSNAVGRPSFVSDRTDKNGRFQLRVYDGGTYYLKVRSVIGGGTPEAGEYQSSTKEFQPVEAVVAKGQKLTGVTVTVDRFTGGKALPGKTSPPKIWKNTPKFQTK